jgi:uncharacterized membrane protein YphA (DoxX/SURF4 family)
MKINQYLHRARFFKYLYFASKLSLGLAFIISGIRKLPGMKFTALPIDNPVGLFFEGMYVTGIYWNFIGVYQILLGILLFTPFWPRLTPIMSIPVTVNIFLVSVGLSMTGTPVITGLMLLSNLYLILFHWDSYSILLEKRPKITIQK